MRTNIPDFLTHYYEKNNGPFRSMTDDGHIKTLEIFSTLKKEGKSIKSQFPDNYPQLRREVENWLRTSFIEKGGRPTKQNPTYTILGTCDWLLGWYENGAKETIPLTRLKNKQVTFTYPDSMISYELCFKKGLLEKIKCDFKEYYGKVYLLEELNDVVSKYGLPKGKTVYGEQILDRYIEMQIWEDIK